MPFFRKKPVVIEAVQWLGYLTPELDNFLYTNCTYRIEGNSLVIRTLEGEMKASVGDWILCGVRGEYYPCAQEIFNETYEEVKDESTT